MQVINDSYYNINPEMSGSIIDIYKTFTTEQF